MKKSLIGYAEPKRIIEVVAAVDEKKLEDFFSSIETHDFEDGYLTPNSEPSDLINTGAQRKVEIEIPEYRLSHADNKLKTSDDIKLTLKAVSEQGVINFKPFTELLGSDSKMNNRKTIMILNQFMNLYIFEKKCVYEEHKFGSIQRAIMTFGGKKDIDDFSALASSLANNTKFLIRVGKRTLLKEMPDDITFSDSIDKKLVK